MSRRLNSGLPLWLTRELDGGGCAMAFPPEAHSNRAYRGHFERAKVFRFGAFISNEWKKEDRDFSEDEAVASGYLQTEVG